MDSEVRSVPSKTSSESNQGKPTSVFKKLGKKPFVIVGTIAIIILAGALLIPQGAAKIPLTVSYIVGEKMVYYTTEEITVQRFNETADKFEEDVHLPNPSLDFTDTVEVVDFDGEAYTLNHTHTMNTNWPTVTFSYVEKMNHTGYSTWIFTRAPNEETLNRSGVTNPALTGLLARSEVTVGDTWVIPVTVNGSYDSMTGNMTLTFVGIQDITVPAGTFKVFRVDSVSNDTVIKFSIPQFNTTTTMFQNISGETYIEYDTGRQIENYMNITLRIQTIAQRSTEELNSTSLSAQEMLENLRLHTQLMQNMMPDENSTPPLQSPSTDEQASSSFLANVVGLDMEHYSVNYGAMEPTGFRKFALKSADSTLDVVLNLNSSRVVWCKIYSVSGSPVFTGSSTGNIEAAKSFLDKYQANAQTAYIPTLRNMLDNFTWLTSDIRGTFTATSTSPTEGEITLNLTIVDDQISDFAWSKTGETSPSNLFTLTIRNGQFEFFCVV